MSTNPFNRAHDPECPHCQWVAESMEDDYDADPYSWRIDRLADDYEKQLDRPWGDAS